MFALLFVFVYFVGIPTPEEPVFDPSELTVKKAISRLPDLDIDDLEAALRAELDGKHRSSLIAEIGRAIDAIKTAEEVEPPETADVEEPAPPAAVVAVPPVPEKKKLSRSDWHRMTRHQRTLWRPCADGSFEEA